MKKTIILGKCDYNNSGRKNCKAEISVELRDTANGRELSICAAIWNPRGTDCYTCGQCVDTVAAYFPENKTAQRLLALWKKYHLNGMNAGTHEQKAAVDGYLYGSGKEYEFGVICAVLKDLGLYTVDASAYSTAAGIPASTGYAYGSQWLFHSLPLEVMAEMVALFEQNG